MKSLKFKLSLLAFVIWFPSIESFASPVAKGNGKRGLEQVEPSVPKLIRNKKQRKRAEPPANVFEIVKGGKVTEVRALPAPDVESDSSGDEEEPVDGIDWALNNPLYQEEVETIEFDFSEHGDYPHPQYFSSYLSDLRKFRNLRTLKIDGLSLTYNNANPFYKYQYEQARNLIKILGDLLPDLNLRGFAFKSAISEDALRDLTAVLEKCDTIESLELKGSTFQNEEKAALIDLIARLPGLKSLIVKRGFLNEKNRKEILKDLSKRVPNFSF